MLICCQVTTAQLKPSDSLEIVQKQGDCTTFAFNYPTHDAAGEDIILSSALMAWTPNERQDVDSIEALHIYSHITLTSDEERPSTPDFSEEMLVLELLIGRYYDGRLDSASSTDFLARCIVIAPDYEGYGVTKDRAHPYLSQRLTAQQVVDAVTYGLDLYRKKAEEGTVLPMKNNWRSFAFGFSQGGAVTLATHRLMEESGLDDDFHFQGSICGDGPYDLVSTIRYYLDDDGTSYDTSTQHRKGFVTMPVVIPLILKGMCDFSPYMKNHRLEDYLSQQFLDTGVLDWIASKEYSTDDISMMWYEQLEEGLDLPNRHYSKEEMEEMFFSPEYGRVWGKMDKIFTPACYEYFCNASNFTSIPIENNDPCYDLHRALVDNSVVSGWTPKHRIQFFHSKGDMVVPYGNYLSFKGSLPDYEGQLYQINNSFTSRDHLDAGKLFFVNMCLFKNFASCFNWLMDGETPTDIKGVEYTKFQDLPHDKGWYTLDGRRLIGKPTQMGVYIHGGKKVVLH